MTFVGCFLFLNVHFVSDLDECSVKRYSILAVTGIGTSVNLEVNIWVSLGAEYFVVK
jgi:hypothetical protein